MQAVAQVFRPLFLPPTTTSSNSNSNSFITTLSTNLSFPNKFRYVCRCKKLEEEALAGLPEHFHDDEWQARQRQKTKEFERLRQEEDEEEERIIDEYREIGMLLKGFPQEQVFKAKKLVSSFLKSAQQIEEKIEEAAERGELDELVLMVIWTRLDLARRDEEKDAIRSLDLLYRRVETEILKRQASPAMRLLNDLLIMHDGCDDEGWLKACKQRMIETFPREDPFSLLVPAGFDLDKHHGPLGRSAMEADNLLLRIDFIREVDTLLKEVKPVEASGSNTETLDPQSVANRLKEQEKKKVIGQVEALLDLAIKLSW